MEEGAGQPDAARGASRGRRGRHGRRDAAGRRVQRDRPVATTYKSLFDKVGVLQKWAEEKALDVPQTDATAAIVGDYVWLYGGSDASGPVALVQRGTIAKPAAAGLPANPEAGKVSDWVSDPVWNLPAPRSNGANWAVNGAMYVAGGTDGTALHNEVYWATPSNDGTIAEWKHLAVSDLPVPAQGGAPVVSGPTRSSSAARPMRAW